MELTLVICVANFTNRFNDALGLRPPASLVGARTPPVGAANWVCRT